RRSLHWRSVSQSSGGQRSTPPISAPITGCSRVTEIVLIRSAAIATFLSRRQRLLRAIYQAGRRHGGALSAPPAYPTERVAQSQYGRDCCAAGFQSSLCRLWVIHVIFAIPSYPGRPESALPEQHHSLITPGKAAGSLPQRLLLQTPMHGPAQQVGRPARATRLSQCPLRSESGRSAALPQSVAMCQKRPYASQQKKRAGAVSYSI